MVKTAVARGTARGTLSTASASEARPLAQGELPRPKGECLAHSPPPAQRGTVSFYRRRPAARGELAGVGARAAAPARGDI